MAIRDRIRFVDWKITQNNVVNISLTGDRYVANIGNSHWEFTLKSAPISRSDVGSKMPLSTDNTDIYTFIIPTPLDDAKGTVSGTVTVSSSTSDGASPAGGSQTINVTGGGGTLLSGDFIKFSNHTKIYMLTAETNLDGSSVDTLYLYPPLNKNVSGATITYDNIQIKAMSVSKAFNYSIGVDDMMEWEQSFREIL
jgi:hypothetical protein